MDTESDDQFLIIQSTIESNKQEADEKETKTDEKQMKNEEKNTSHRKLPSFYSINNGSD